MFLILVSSSYSSNILAWITTTPAIIINCQTFFSMVQFQDPTKKACSNADFKDPWRLRENKKQIEQLLQFVFATTTLL